MGIGKVGSNVCAFCTPLWYPGNERIVQRWKRGEVEVVSGCGPAVGRSRADARVDVEAVTGDRAHPKRSVHWSPFAVGQRVEIRQKNSYSKGLHT